MTFGQRVRELRHAKEWSLRDLAAKVDVGVTDLSRVENERLNFGDYPSDALIHRLADALEADEEELLILAHSLMIRSPMLLVGWRRKSIQISGPGVKSCRGRGSRKIHWSFKLPILSVVTLLRQVFFYEATIIYFSNTWGSGILEESNPCPGRQQERHYA